MRASKGSEGKRERGFHVVRYECCQPTGDSTRCRVADIKSKAKIVEVVAAKDVMEKELRQQAPPPAWLADSAVASHIAPLRVAARIHLPQPYSDASMEPELPRDPTLTDRTRSLAEIASCTALAVTQQSDRLCCGSLAQASLLEGELDKATRTADRLQAIR